MRLGASGVLFATAVVVALAGCGSASHLSKAQYTSLLQRDLKAFKSVEPRFERITPTTNLAVRIVADDDAYRAVNRLVVDLASINPPPDAVKDNAALVSEMRLIRHGTVQVRKDMLAGKNADARQVILALLHGPETRAATAALEDLTKKGYFATR